MHTDVVADGPLAGRHITSHHPTFLLADRPNGLAWVYRLDSSGWRVVPDDDGQLERALDGDRAIATALGDGYDVIAHPDVD
jgi:hypothetical protein